MSTLETLRQNYLKKTIKKECLHGFEAKNYIKRLKFGPPQLLYVFYITLLFIHFSKCRDTMKCANLSHVHILSLIYDTYTEL